MAVSGREYKLEARIGVACGVGLAELDAKRPPRSELLVWRRWAGGGGRKWRSVTRATASRGGDGPHKVSSAFPLAPSLVSGEVPNGCPRGLLGAGRARARAHGELAHGWAGLGPAPPPPPPPSRRRCGRRARRRPRGDGAGLLG